MEGDVGYSLHARGGGGERGWCFLGCKRRRLKSARDVTGAGGGGGGGGGDQGEGNRREHCSVSVLLQGSSTGTSARACMHDVTRVLEVGGIKRVYNRKLGKLACQNSAPLRWWQWWGKARDVVTRAVTCDTGAECRGKGKN